jgi:hypothetical protein
MSLARTSTAGLLCGLLLVAGIATAQWRFKTAVVETLPAGEADWTAGVVRSTVTERVDSRPSPQAAAYAQAVRTAHRRLFEALTQLQLDAKRTVGSVLQGAAATRQGLVSVADEADVVRTRYLPRYTVEVTLQTALAGRVTSLLWPGGATVAGTAGEMTDEGYTGIIIDARGLAIRPALFPEVLDEDGEAVYAPQLVSGTAAIERGYVFYTNALDHPQVEPRVGEHPLVVQARRVAGEMRVNVLIRRSDAERMRQSPTIRRLLERCQVLIAG